MDRIAQILAQQGGINPVPLGQLQTVSDPSFAPMQDTAAAEPFTWGSGGRRLSMDDISRERELAEQQQQAGADYSPIASPWQGLARFSQGVIGGLGQKRADKDAAAYQAQQAGELAALSDGQKGYSPAVLAALSGGDPLAQKIALGQVERANPKQTAPHYWETNDGSLAVIGPDGQPQVLYDDPTPKINWIQADNGDGTKSLIPVGPNGPVNGGNGGGPSLPPLGGSQPPGAGGFMTLGQFQSMQGSPDFGPNSLVWATPVQISGDADFDALPSGKTFVGPDGIVRTK